MPSFVKKLSAQFPDIRFLSYYTPFTFNAIVLEQFLILLLSLFLSYQFSNYTIYATLYLPYFRTFDSDNCPSKIYSRLVNGHFNELVLHHISKN